MSRYNLRRSARPTGFYRDLNSGRAIENAIE